jgi:aspartyl-tRNA synthetase
MVIFALNFQEKLEMKFNKRTNTCGELRENNAGDKVVLNGWIDNQRNLGGVIFIQMRDRYGITQVVFEDTENKELYTLAKSVRNEFVLSVEGTVRLRPAGSENKNMPTGMVDVVVEKLIILNEAETPPFPIQEFVDVSEDLRLKYRFLDLRRPSMQRNLILRHKICQSARRYLDEQSFIEIETPILLKSTPEGARDFLVPSRLHKGSFYALPQSPQTYKQILMVSGFDRYFQMAKCFRDEDLRADRQYEFTQIDCEMSFVDVEDMYEIFEGLMKRLFKEIKGYDLKTPIPRIPYDIAMERYGSDKPDLRFAAEMITLNDLLGSTGFKVFKDAIENKGIVTALVAKGYGTITRSQIDGLTDFVKKLGAGGLAYIKVKEDGIDSPIAKFLNDEEKKSIVEKTKAESEDLILILSGRRNKTLPVMGALRLEIAKRLNLIKPDCEPALLWVTDFPLFEWDDETQRYYAMHHMFTSPRIEDIPFLESDPSKVKARAYDIVMNGNEIGGGSIRIHDSVLQAKMFKALGMSEEEARQKFGFLMNAFKYGAPPHGGIAFGLDRLVMLFAGKDSIRDVIAFPKTTSGLSLMDDSPTPVDDSQLKELGIKVRDEKGN